MNIQQREEQNITIFVLHGRIDTQGAITLEKTLQQAVDEGRHKMVLDVENVRYINSAALRTLANVLTHNRSQHGDLYVTGIAPRIKRVFEIIGFDRFFTFFETVDDAVAAFQAEDQRN